MCRHTLTSLLYVLDQLLEIKMQLRHTYVPWLLSSMQHTVSRELSLLFLVHLDVQKLHSSLPLQVNKKAVIKDFTTIFTILEN